jgi:hypothetical protein
LTPTPRSSTCRRFHALAAGAVLATALALPLVAGARASADEAVEPETIVLQPDDRAGWSMRNVFAPITGLFLGGPGYWYSERVVEVESTPPGAVVDLFYVRSNFQKRYEQAETPVRVVLPRRIEAGPRDALAVRALLEGYKQQSVTIPVSSRQKRVLFELAPLPNSLVAVAHRYLAGRGSLTFLTKEALTFRLSQAKEGFSVILTETGRSAEAKAALDSLHSPLVREAVSRQLGEDLVVTLDMSESAITAGYDLPTWQGFDPARSLHVFGFRIEPKGGVGDAVQRARAALQRVETRDVTGCALAFESVLRDGLDPAQLARALAPSGEFTDPYFRAAMRRLGELTPGGVVEFSDGSRFRPSAPIELEAAMSQASGARGYLSLLRRFVAELEPPEQRREVYGGLIAPERDPARFDALMKDAEARESSCSGSAARRGADLG